MDDASWNHQLGHRPEHQPISGVQRLSGRLWGWFAECLERIGLETKNGIPRPAADSTCLAGSPRFREFNEMRSLEVLLAVPSPKVWHRWDGH